MFERFTDAGRRVIVLAQEEAREMNHNYIGTEHLLLGILQDEDDAAAVLVAAGLSVASARDRLLAIVGTGKKAATGHIPFTPRAKKVLELSRHESQRLGHTYIGPEHLLLGLIREGDGVGAQVLLQATGDLDGLRDTVIASIPAGSRTSRLPDDGRARLAEVESALRETRRRLDAIERRLGPG